MNQQFLSKVKSLKPKAEQSVLPAAAFGLSSLQLLTKVTEWSAR